MPYLLLVGSSVFSFVLHLTLGVVSGLALVFVDGVILGAVGGLALLGDDDEFLIHFLNHR